jgi:hypothetical protein
MKAVGPIAKSENLLAKTVKLVKFFKIRNKPVIPHVNHADTAFYAI